MEKFKIQNFNQKLTDERLHGNKRHQNELKSLYKEIISEMASDYDEYRNHVPDFLQSLENNRDASVPYSIDLFLELYDEFLNSKSFSQFDLSIMDHDPDDSTFEMMAPILEDSYMKNKAQRVSEDYFDLSTISGDDRKKMATLIIRKIQNDAKTLNWDDDLVFSNMSIAGFLRQILATLNNTELFYHTVGLIIDRFSSSEFNQAGRDFAEELIFSSYKQNVPHAGYFSAFRMYSNIQSIHASLIYANLSLTCILKKEPPYSDRFAREVIWQSMKFFRNVKLHHFAVEIYNGLPPSLNFPPYERRSLDHSYFTCLLSYHAPSLPSLLIDYLRREREKILEGGVHDAMPWLVILYNIKRIYPLADFSPNGFGFFLTTFELIVPADQVKKYKDVIEADSADLKKHLMESLVKLNETRNTADFVYDNRNALLISERLIEYSVKKEDAAAFLLSMVMKSDYSILFQEKQYQEFVPLILPKVNADELETFYDNTVDFLQKLSLGPTISMCWLAVSEEKLYQLQLVNVTFSFHPAEKWDLGMYRKLVDTDYFASLKFDDTKKTPRGVIQLFPEDHEVIEKKVIQELNIAEMLVDDKADELYIVKSMELSKFPHNLLVDKTGDFIAKKIPVTNVLSTEWLLQADKSQQLPNDFKKAAWIPTDSDDNDLHWLFGNIEDALKEHSFETFKTIELEKPLSADINIVCSHGAKNISDTQIISQEGHYTYDLNKIIGKGKVLIFFVCHSGSMKTEFFRNDVSSLIKRFIARGYDAVIAPGWALDVTVPRYWLPEFLRSFESGETISRAMFNANKKVYERYPNPAAWACLHLYGNPNLTIKQ